MIAAIVMGRGVLPMPGGGPPTFDFGVFAVAMLVHSVLSVLFACVLAAIVNRMTLWTALLAGAIFGVALYIVNFYIFTAVFPWFAMGRTWVTVFSHVSFGIAAAWTYRALAGRTRPYAVAA